MENYKQIKVLGKGSFGSAWLVQRVKDKLNFVAKEVRIANMKPSERDSAKHEITMLRGLQHPNITRYIDHFEHRGSLYIVMEYANGGDLYEKVKARRGNRLTEKEILHYFSQICLALQHLHEHRILHRDLKSQNVFLTADGIVKLGDFGISTVLRNTYELKKTVCGTPYYFSPELCLNKPYNNKSDVWALGCILYELTTLNHAFDGNNIKGLVQKILKGVYPPIHPSYSSDLSKLIASMLKLDPNQRPNVQQILQLPFVRAFLGGLEADMRGAVEQHKPLVGAEEREKIQRAAQARVEANRGVEQARQEKAAAAIDAREVVRLQKMDEHKRAIEQQIREHDDRMRKLREKQCEDEESQRKKKELEERMKEQRRVQQERMAQQAKIQKQREEDWERNMKQQQEEHKRRQELQQQPYSPPLAAQQQGGSPTPPLVKVGGGYDPNDAARVYREMRREAQANKLRAFDNGAMGLHQQPQPALSPQQPRLSPVGNNNAASPPPVPHAPAVGRSEVELEEARKAAYWQMRREAEENKRRIMGFEPTPQVQHGVASPPQPTQQPLSHFAPHGQQQQQPETGARRISPPNGTPLSPPQRQQQPVVPPRVVSPPPRVTSPPVASQQLQPKPTPAAQAVGGNSSDDEDVGYHEFLNGEAIANAAGVDDKATEPEYAKLQAAIHNALAKSAETGSGAVGGGAGADAQDFADPDEHDPSRFIFQGQTLHLPNCAAADPLMSRIESLRLFLESSLGEPLFLQAYKVLDNMSELDDDDATMAQVEHILPVSLHGYIPVISQLLVCEAFFNRQ